eukprot:3821818-Rhodomonas_salina.2
MPAIAFLALNRWACVCSISQQICTGSGIYTPMRYWERQIGTGSGATQARGGGRGGRREEGGEGTRGREEGEAGEKRKHQKEKEEEEEEEKERRRRERKEEHP